jgi:hypothetical protein
MLRYSGREGERADVEERPRSAEEASICKVGRGLLYSLDADLLWPIGRSSSTAWSGALHWAGELLTVAELYPLLSPPPHPPFSPEHHHRICHLPSLHTSGLETCGDDNAEEKQGGAAAARSACGASILVGPYLSRRLSDTHSRLGPTAVWARPASAMELHMQS